MSTYSALGNERGGLVLLVHCGSLVGLDLVGPITFQLVLSLYPFTPCEAPRLLSLELLKTVLCVSATFFTVQLDLLGELHGGEWYQKGLKGCEGFIQNSSVK